MDLELKTTTKNKLTHSRKISKRPLEILNISWIYWIKHQDTEKAFQAQKDNLIKKCHRTHTTQRKHIDEKTLASVLHSKCH